MKKNLFLLFIVITLVVSTLSLNAFCETIDVDKDTVAIPDEVYSSLDSKVIKVYNDSKSGIKVYFTDKSYVEGSTLTMEVIDRDHADFEDVEDEFDEMVYDNTDRVKFYRVSLKDSRGNKIDVPGNVAIMLPVPDDYDLTEEDLSVYALNRNKDDRYDTDDNLVKVGNKEYYMIVTDQLKDFALVDINTKSFTLYYVIAGASVVVIAAIVMIVSFRKKAKAAK